VEEKAADQAEEATGRNGTKKPVKTSRENLAQENVPFPHCCFPKVFFICGGARA
jgi:hypothetical protein